METLTSIVQGRETHEIHIPDDLAEHLKDPAADHAEALHDFLEGETESWQWLLKAYMNHDRGVISDSTLSLNHVETSDDGEWIMEVSFEEFEVAGCSDHDVNEDRAVTLDLKISLKKKVLVIFGEADVDLTSGIDDE